MQCRSEIVGAAPYKGQRHMNMESLYEYGSRAGFWRLHRLFTERHMPCTVYACALALQRNPEAAQAMVGESCVRLSSIHLAESHQNLPAAILQERDVSDDGPR